MRRYSLASPIPIKFFLTQMFYQAAHILVSFFAKIIFRLRVIGVENIPKAGGVIISANHNSYFDIPLLGCALPRPVDNIAKSELFRNKIIAILFRKLGGFPIRRGQMDRSAIKEAVDRLKAGGMLSYYPEGTRSKDGSLQAPKAGIGRIVVKSGARVVPVYIHGTHCPRPFRRVTVYFGKPIDFQMEIEKAEKEGVHAKALYATISGRIMREISVLEKQLTDSISSKNALQDVGGS